LPHLQNLVRLPHLLSHQPHQLADTGIAAEEKLQQEKEKHPVGVAESTRPAAVVNWKVLIETSALF